MAPLLTKPRFLADRRGIGFVLLLGCLVVALYYFPVTYGDWWGFFRPAALSLPNPYQVKGILNPLGPSYFSTLWLYCLVGGVAWR